VVEGAVLGFLVGFLVRVKPEMIGWQAKGKKQKAKGKKEPVTIAMLITVACLAIGPWSVAYAHRLNTGYKVTGPSTVQVESWFDTGGSPKSATVEVLRADGRPLIEGKMDANGVFVFRFEEAETLKVVVSAGDGHRSEIEIPATALMSTPISEAAESRPINPQPLVDRESAIPFKDVLLGVTFVLALAAFVLALRNARGKGA
jgi:nickel transport protein